VELTLAGDAQPPTRFRTKSVNDNGYNPAWHETFNYLVSNGMIAFLRITISDQDMKAHESLATCCVPLALLLPGYRHLPLYDWKGELLPTSAIFIRTQMKEVAVPKPAPDVKESPTLPPPVTQ